VCRGGETRGCPSGPVHSPRGRGQPRTRSPALTFTLTRTLALTPTSTPALTLTPGRLLLVLYSSDLGRLYSFACKAPQVRPDMANQIREVWAENLEMEMVNLRDMVERYPYVAMVGLRSYTDASLTCRDRLLLHSETLMAACLPPPFSLLLLLTCCRILNFPGS
jgi:hypothetical protein